MRGGIISAGGVGFDISCGIRCLRTDLTLDQLAPRLGLLADRLYRDIPAGVGEEGQLKLTPRELDDVLEGGAQWAVRRGYGSAADLEFVEERGRIEGAVPGNVSELAKAASRLGIELPDRELACAPIRSPEGEQYIGAMNAAINCALANRQLLAHLTRQTIARDFPHARLETLFDVSQQRALRVNAQSNLADAEYNLVVNQAAMAYFTGELNPAGLTLGR